MFQVIVLFLVLSVELSASTNPGVKFRVNKKGVDYGEFGNQRYLW